MHSTVSHTYIFTRVRVSTLNSAPADVELYSTWWNQPPPQPDIQIKNAKLLFLHLLNRHNAFFPQFFFHTHFSIFFSNVERCIQASILNASCSLILWKSISSQSNWFWAVLYCELVRVERLKKKKNNKCENRESHNHFFANYFSTKRNLLHCQRQINDNIKMEISL